VSELLCRQQFASEEQAWEELLSLLDDWTQRLRLPTLDHYGITAADFTRVVAHSRGSSMKTNPIVLSDEEIKAVLVQRCAAGL
jgi:alcohol dehydrogenase